MSLQPGASILGHNNTFVISRLRYESSADGILLLRTPRHAVGGLRAVRPLSRCHIQSASLHLVARSVPMFGPPSWPSFTAFTRRRACLRPDTTNFEVNSEIMGCQLRAPWRHHHQQAACWLSESCGRVVSLMID